MSFTFRHALALSIPIIVAAGMPSLAQEPSLESTPSAKAGLPSNPPKVVTGKERLGDKWMDEQRVDNCKVAVDKRGPKPRPDACSGDHN